MALGKPILQLGPSIPNACFCVCRRMAGPWWKRENHLRIQHTHTHTPMFAVYPGCGSTAPFIRAKAPGAQRFCESARVGIASRKHSTGAMCKEKSAVHPWLTTTPMAQDQAEAGTFALHCSGSSKKQPLVHSTYLSQT